MPELDLVTAQQIIAATLAGKTGEQDEALAIHAIESAGRVAATR